MDNCKYRHILFLSYKDICYNSTSYFEQRISEELINAGIKVTHLNIPKPAKGLSGTLADTAYMLLKPYFNADLDAIIDINTTIPCIKYNNGYILNNFDIPVWHYILDHPLYHYKALKVQLNNYNVICLDTFHAKLIRESFPHIREVKVIPLSADETGIGGMKEVEFMVKGQGAYSVMKYESGVHRVQRVPVTESNGRIQTSTASVAVMPEAEEVDIQIDDKDIRIDVMRASGNGGQCVNTTDSAVRLTHYPTGIVIYSQTEKSQIQNKEKAFALLRAKLYDLETQKAHDAEADARRSQIGTGDRAEKIRTYNFPQGRVTDHRIGLTLYKLDKIMNGDIQEIIDACIAADQAAKLAKMGEE